MSSVSRGNYFYSDGASLTADFKDTALEFKFSSRHLAIAVEGGDIQFSLVGADNTKFDGLIKAADGLVSFPGLEANRIALKQVSGTVTLWRLFAYK